MTVSVERLIALLDRAEEIEPLVGGAWTAFRDRIAKLVERLDSEAQDSRFDADVDRLMNDLFETAAQSIVKEVDRSVAKRHLEEGARSRGLTRSAGDQDSEPEGYIRFPVYFATDRAEIPDAPPTRRFSGNRNDGELRWGLAHVSIPDLDRDKGDLPGPTWWRGQFRPDPTRHIALLDIETMPLEDLLETLREALGTADSRDSLVFVHGYNVGFGDAARRTAQIAHDLRFKGRTLLYSWPSRGTMLGYGADEATIEWSTPHFREFLITVLTQIGARNVHVIAHSMGNRALVRALEQLDSSSLPQGSAKLRQIVFAAPDVDRRVFEQIAESFHGPADRMTLYASDGDFALRFSRLIHRFPRAGRVADGITLVESVDTIDASDADSSLFGLGHSYFAEKRSILVDIFELVERATPPDERFGLEPRSSSRGQYWYLDASSA